MSYCVNCGVELEENLNHCPLCNTPVYHPEKRPELVKSSPFPTEKGPVEKVKRKDLAILLSVVLISTSATCTLLNLLVFNQSLWSLFIVGVCACIWIFMIPVVIYSRLPIYISLLLDGLALGSYLYLISLVTTSDTWFYELAIPIVVLFTIQMEVFTYFMRRFPVSFITTALYTFIHIAIFCVGLEIFISMFLLGSIRLIWSAIVLTICLIIIISLITILSRQRLRDSIRKRLHF